MTVCVWHPNATLRRPRAAVGSRSDRAQIIRDTGSFSALGNGLGSLVVAVALDAVSAHIRSKSAMQIEVFADVTCPWCFIARRRLARALAVAGVRAELRYRAFQLQPGLPSEGVPAVAFFERKFGGKERMRARFERITELGRAEGIAFDFARQHRAPNTELCHRVIQLASKWQQADAAMEALSRGYCEQGANLSELSEIVSVLEQYGVPLDSAELVARLAAGAGQEELVRDRQQAADYGVGVVPLFIFAQRYAIEGAQPVEHFQRLIAKLRAESARSSHGASPLQA